VKYNNSLGGRQMARKKVEKPTEEVVGQELLSLDAAAEALQVSRSTLTRWLSEGRVKGFKMGRQWRFRRADLDRFSQMAHPSAAAVNVSEFEAATASLGASPSDLEALSTDPALSNYPNTEEEIAVDNLFLSLLVNALGANVVSALAVNASDVHLELTQDGSVVRTRIDGVLHETVRLPRAAHKALVTCVKYHADLPVDQPSVNHDGIFRLRQGDQTYHVRVSSIPAVYGESVVMRILPQSSLIPDLNRIGMRPEDQERYLHALRYPVGLVILSGPTGSGKTTVMYSGIQQVAKPEIKTLSIEDPVEVVIPWMTQIPVNRKAGMTFEHTVRAIMRHDPDVVMVGAINSLEVAEGCLQAAITGHLVVSQLHASSAALAVKRLLEMGLEPFMVSQALICVVATRLARKVCAECRAPEEVPFDLLSPLAEVARQGGYRLPDNPEFLCGTGCGHCHGTGYRGRIGLYEVMPMEEDLMRLVLAGASARELQEAAVRKGMTTLAADGLRKAAEGITSVFEAARVTYTPE
jgi:excisionase family DNA binding protein